MKRLYLAILVTVCVLAVSSEGEAEFSPAVKQALLDLYYFTNGPNWVQSCSYNRKIGCWLNFTESPSTWFGFSFDQRGPPYLLLDLGHNNLTGTLPESLAGLEELNVIGLFLPGNQLAGTLPHSFQNWTGLASLDLRANQIEGIIPASWDTLRLQFLDLGENLLHGSIPEFIFHSNLSHLYLARNNFTHYLPYVREPLSSLSLIDLSSNRLQGPLQQLFDNFVQIGAINVGFNRFDGFVPTLPVSSRHTCQTYILNNNELTGVFPNNLYLPVAQYIRVDNNHIYGEIPNDESSGFYFFVKAVDINLGFNNFSGALPDVALRQLGSNYATGYLSTADFDGNPYMRDPGLPGVPDWLYADPSIALRVDDDSSTFLCMPLEIQPTRRCLVRVSPEYLQYAQCYCRFGRYGNPPDNCAKCPTAGTCPGGTDVYWERGFYPTLDQQNSLIGFERCSDSELLGAESSACNPDRNCSLSLGQTPTCRLCDTGYFGRMCSGCQCEENETDCFFRSAGKCLRCKSPPFTSSQFLGVVFAVLAAAIVLLVAVFLILSSPKKPTAEVSPLKRVWHVRRDVSRYLKLFILYVQTVAAVMHWPYQLLPQVGGVLEFLKGRTEGFGVDCAVPNEYRNNSLYYTELGYQLLPIAGLVAISIAALLALPIRFLLNKRLKKQNANGYRRVADQESDIILGSVDGDGSAPEIAIGLQARSIFELWATSVLAVLYFLYFGLTHSALEVFHCSSPTGLPSVTYMASYPWLQCNSEAPYSPLRTVAIVATVFYVIGIPALFTSLLFFLRRRISALASTDDDFVQDTLPEGRGVTGMVAKASSVLWGNYNSKIYWFELAIIARRLLLAVALAWSPPDLISFSVMLVLLVALLVHLRFRPYKSKMENLAEAACLASLLFAYSAQESSLQPSGDALPNDWVGWILLVASIGSNSLVFLGLVLMFIWALVKAIRARLCNIPGSGPDKDRLD